MKDIRINKETGIRLTVLILALINQALVIFGISPIPFTSAEIEAGVSIVFSVIATLWATWKNNDVTPEAHRATRSEERRVGKEGRGRGGAEAPRETRETRESRESMQC